ncbi:HEAT repeat domain-containing protein, partial [Singulisphaera rosea]
MLATTLGALLLSSQSLLGFHGHHGKAKGSCDLCGAEKSEVMREIVRLQRSWRWQERDDAAEELREFDWRCHPEVVGALVFALLNDRNEEVREEAAESLAKMAPCLPEAHLALSRAAA